MLADRNQIWVEAFHHLAASVFGTDRQKSCLGSGVFNTGGHTGQRVTLLMEMLETPFAVSATQTGAASDRFPMSLYELSG